MAAIMGTVDYLIEVLCSHGHDHICPVEITLHGDRCILGVCFCGGAAEGGQRPRLGEARVVTTDEAIAEQLGIQIKCWTVLPVALVDRVIEDHGGTSVDYLVLDVLLTLGLEWDEAMGMALRDG